MAADRSGPLFLFALFFLAIVTIALADDPFIDDQNAAKCNGQYAAYQSACNAIKPTDHCSSQLVDVCCACQNTWAISFAACSFSLNIGPTPSPTPDGDPTGPETPGDTVSGGELPPIPLPQACLNGHDKGGDGIIDGIGKPCVYVTGCKALDMNEIRALALEQWIVIQKGIKQTANVLKNVPADAPSSKVVEEYLAKFTKGLTKSLKKKSVLALEGLTALGEFPEFVVTCVPQTTGCTEANFATTLTASAKKVKGYYYPIALKLKKSALFAKPFNKVAYLKRMKLYQKLKGAGTDLLEIVDAIPEEQWVCEGANSSSV